MAKSYVLSESDRKTLSRMLSWWRGGGPGKSSRPTPTRRRNYSGGGSAPAAAIQRALIFGEVPAASFDAPSQEITPGDSNGAIALVMRWNAAGTKLERDTDIEPIICRNVTSGSKVIGTPTDPVAMMGTVENINDISYFVLSPFDLYTLEGNEEGTALAPGATDDPGLKVPYKSSGTRAYSVETVPCSS